ncbi:MAG: hypothetical protein O7H41_08440 [Planctomycetota bacterium]|nr:hypothetical protein [Planctomycetota bacterium]
MSKKGELQGSGGTTQAKIVLRMPKALRVELQRLADKDERTLSDVCRRILRWYIEGKKGGKR